MIRRSFSQTIHNYIKSFPALILLGARQVGKTTILKEELSKTHKYVLLEDPDVRSLALNDPRSFLEKYSPPVIIDEFQYVPELMAYLQGAIDSNRGKKGQFILTGSQNFQMMEQVTQSLAGRVGVLTLYGLSSEEIATVHSINNPQDILKIILRGSYPELWKEQELDKRIWLSSYIQTFLERDLRTLAQIGDLSSFERFLKVCAIRTGQILNISDLAADSGISSPTAQKWISILERAYIIRLVEPYYNNVTSRVRKARKLYFMDTAVASYLMGYRDEDALLNSPHIGALFETLVFTDFIKRTSSLGEIPDHFYLQTKSKVGVDFIIQKNQKIDLWEIKFTQTFQNKNADQLLLTAPNFKNVNTLNLISLYDGVLKTKINGLAVNLKKWNEMN